MRLQGALCDFRPWSPEEDAVLREAYTSGGIHEAMRRLPDRSQIALYKRARALKLSRRRHWTASDDKQLRDLWEDGYRLATIAEKLGRTPIGVYGRMRAIGLRLGVPDGYEYLSAAAARTGYTSTQLRPILRWAGVRIQMAITLPNESMRRTHFVDPVEVDYAIEEWNKTEPVEAAARRLGVCGMSLWKWLRAAGIDAKDRRKREHLRLYPEHVDAAVAAWRGKMSNVSVREAGAKLGVNPYTLASCLRRAGVRRNPGRVWYVDLEEARAAYAAHFGGVYPERTRKGLAVKAEKSANESFRCLARDELVGNRE